MNEQHNWSEFEASMDAVDRGGGGQQSEAKQKTDAFSPAENFAKSPSVVLMTQESIRTMSDVLRNASVLLDHLRDLVDPDDEQTILAIEDIIDDMVDIHEQLEDVLLDEENDK
jgi:hypothetical protein